MARTAAPAVEPLSGPTGRRVAIHRDDVRRVLRGHGITDARLFGSVARGDDHEGSDVDLLVTFPADTSLFDILRIQDELESILGVRVDLISEGGLREPVRTEIQEDLIAL